jgi:hypothetical protein
MSKAAGTEPAAEALQSLTVDAPGYAAYPGAPLGSVGFGCKHDQIERTSYETLCQNCVRLPVELRSDIVIYRVTPRHIVVAEVVDRECVGGFQCASARVSAINFQACSFNHSDISPYF